MIDKVKLNQIVVFTSAGENFITIQVPNSLLRTKGITSQLKDLLVNTISYLETNPDTKSAIDNGPDELMFVLDKDDIKNLVNSDSSLEIEEVLKGLIKESKETKTNPILILVTNTTYIYSFARICNKYNTAISRYYDVFVKNSSVDIYDAICKLNLFNLYKH